MVDEIFPKTILNKHKRRDPWFLDDYSLNPYRLCDFNCVYCYVRGSKYGERMGNHLAVKVNAPSLLAMELSKRAGKGEHGFIALSSETEPWMNIERTYEVTRRCLRVIARYRFPVHCLTKSSLILRDLDILEEVDKTAILPEDLRKVGHGALITFSISVLDERAARLFEPGAPSPRERLETLWKVREAGLHAGIAYIPILPFISDNDEHLEEMIKKAKEFQASYVFVGSLTLYGAGKRLYYSIIEKHFPELLPGYERLYGNSNQPSKAYQRKLEERAKALCKKYGVKYKIL